MTSDKHENARFAQLSRWLDHVLPEHTELEPASGDASFRRYFRLFSGSRSWIVMDAPPEQEDCAPFIDVCERLAAAGLRVPGVFQHDLTQGFLLLDDLGEQTFLAALSPANAPVAYRRAIAALVRLQGADATGLPDYDAALLRRELDLFSHWYLGVHRGRELSGAERRGWDEVCAALVASALAQPRCFVHRDYHSRNLMWAPEGDLGILDFQDAVQGPVSYDLVSLLRDCYVDWPAEQQQAWVADYHRQAAAAGIALPGLERFQRDFDWMGVQRHLKAIGIFARLNHRDGKSGYLADIPRTLGYVRHVAAIYPELSLLRQWADECLA